MGFGFIDNTGTAPKEGSLEALKNIDYTGVGEQLEALINEKLQAGDHSTILQPHELDCDGVGLALV